ncbi:hypothetical protein P175DRAFT_0461003 [Aspergillus ochraceoroseus IBT 24754]|uniref:Uncharacterized protein n=3 Tax=Aspergillus subgen. Nidulantes TaxID=2720870 RepID=A0A0F8V3S5_9EURO|nr:uncharacterized protein P175DRAFT_0461003 [Aspergillus ochraceoroseus IBT 24754]KKK25049.1 hypothetical protein AOCH_003732 [Aspergillus ochraceoroseus]KKK26409.1 hypothetical protein ARAM_002172 [Aspergillus rambellii]PTU20300.1 hypothetical protein P175DRAFT_0461003 [Aspergillus ochraceoroseus IBT 24754]
MMFSAVVLSVLAISGSALASPAEKRAGVTCGGVGNYAPINDVKTCIDFLNSKGTADCGVGNGSGGFCVHGQAVILGSGSGSTPCQNVAAAAQAILGSCTTANQYVGGTSTVGGASSVVVTVRHS